MNEGYHVKCFPETSQRMEKKTTGKKITRNVTAYNRYQKLNCVGFLFMFLWYWYCLWRAVPEMFNTIFVDIDSWHSDDRLLFAVYPAEGFFEEIILRLRCQ